MVAGPGDERAAAEGRGRGELRASDADREQVIEVLKAAFVQGRLAKDEFDLRVGQAFAARTGAELAAVTAGLPAEPTAAKPPAPARARCEPPVVRPGPLIAVATAVCAGVWMFGFLVPWPRDSEGDPPHGVALLVFSTTLIYLFVLVMTLWLSGAVMVESWLKRRAARTRPNPTRLRHADDSVAVALSMSNISGVVARVFVDDLDAASADSGSPRPPRSTASVSVTFSWLRLAVPAAQRRHGQIPRPGGDDPGPASATRRLAIQAAGGHILEGPAPAPNGDRLIARHPDGAVFEYIETGEPQP